MSFRRESIGILVTKRYPDAQPRPGTPATACHPGRTAQPTTPRPRPTRPTSPEARCSATSPISPNPLQGDEVAPDELGRLERFKAELLGAKS